MATGASHVQLHSSSGVYLGEDNEMIIEFAFVLLPSGSSLRHEVRPTDIAYRVELSRGPISWSDRR